jgi:hypothetical protein
MLLKNRLSLLMELLYQQMTRRKIRLPRQVKNPWKSRVLRQLKNRVRALVQHKNPVNRHHPQKTHQHPSKLLKILTKGHQLHKLHREPELQHPSKLVQSQGHLLAVDHRNLQELQPHRDPRVEGHHKGHQHPNKQADNLRRRKRRPQHPDSHLSVMPHQTLQQKKRYPPLLQLQNWPKKRKYQRSHLIHW